MLQAPWCHQPCWVMNIWCQANSIVMNTLCSPWRTFYGNSPGAYGSFPLACRFNLTWEWKHVDIRRGVRQMISCVEQAVCVSFVLHVKQKQECVIWMPVGSGLKSSHGIIFSDWLGGYGSRVVQNALWSVSFTGLIMVRALFSGSQSRSEMRHDIIMALDNAGPPQ